ncbi:UNVERIFIED_ORG: hypothetical protein CLV66_11625 [Actinomadura viridilutea]|uniref:hypothetical protein n=1 Tax=Actinomadura rubrobrunea TaxID=115335 RepID=UPI0008336CC1|nr:hypothetical protein [Actinomadura rubrobrunea]
MRPLPGGPHAFSPGSAQPAHRADRPPVPEASAPVPDELHGTATWFGAGESADAGLAYPAVDPEGDAGGCPETVGGCTPLPYVSLGSELTVRNDCTRRVATFAVTECGCVAARYCDRCVICGPSPRGRLVELAPVGFVGLGGDLEAGCFNATVRHASAPVRGAAAPGVEG